MTELKISDVLSTYLDDIRERDDKIKYIKKDLNDILKMFDFPFGRNMQAIYDKLKEVVKGIK